MSYWTSVIILDLYALDVQTEGVVRGRIASSGQSALVLSIQIDFREALTSLVGGATVQSSSSGRTAKSTKIFRHGLFTRTGKVTLTLPGPGPCRLCSSCL